jgi:hypothetical protein
MDVNKTVSGELAAILPMIADTMKFATHALAQSTAVYEVMIAKGLATRAELEAAMRSTDALREKLSNVLDKGWKTN